MKKLLFLTAFFLGGMIFSAQEAPFSLAQDLFNQEDADALGLLPAEGTETFTVFKAGEQGDRFCNGVVLAEFNGKLYCQWQSSAKDEDAPDTKVVYSISEDEGKTWSEPMVLAPTIKDGYRSSGGWLVNNNKLIAFINEWPANVSPRGGFTYFSTSKDGKKWSKLKPVKMKDGKILDGIFEQDPHVLLSGSNAGRIINAAHFQKGLYVCPIYTDDPSGTSGWVKGTFTGKDSGSSTSVEMEPSSFVNSEGKIVMVFRDQKGSYKKLASVSSNNGQSWSDAVLTEMPDARTKQCAGNLKTPDSKEGVAFMAGNPVNNKLRSPLAITLSKDGKIFDKAFLLRSGASDPEVVYEGKAKRKGFHYPKALVSDKYLYVAYATNKELVDITRIPLKSLEY